VRIFVPIWQAYPTPFYPHQRKPQFSSPSHVLFLCTQWENIALRLSPSFYCERDTAIPSSLKSLLTRVDLSRISCLRIFHFTHFSVMAVGLFRTADIVSFRSTLPLYCARWRHSQTPTSPLLFMTICLPFSALSTFQGATHFFPPYFFFCSLSITVPKGKFTKE